ncbi:hypothetical protein BH10PSE7_BH10PSE7_35830 [soil metagenome]
MVRRTVLVIAGLLLAACGEDVSKPYLEFAGGGFVFNYRNAEAFYGFVARPVRPMPDKAIIEVQFEMPGGAPPGIQREPARSGQMKYSFKSAQLSGVVKNHDYKVVVRVLDGPTGKELARYDHAFRSDVDQASLPSKPLVVGPGYEPNPDLAPN